MLYEVITDNNFCDECGYDLAKPKKTPALDYSTPQSYTPKYLADKILTTRSSIEGERKLVTVLFADVANYTALSEKLDPEEVHQIMDGCFKILMDEIRITSYNVCYTKLLRTTNIATIASCEETSRGFT